MTRVLLILHSWIEANTVGGYNTITGHYSATTVRIETLILSQVLMMSSSAAFTAMKSLRCSKLLQNVFHNGCKITKHVYESISYSPLCGKVTIHSLNGLLLSHSARTAPIMLVQVCSDSYQITLIKGCH